MASLSDGERKKKGKNTFLGPRSRGTNGGEKREISASASGEREQGAFDISPGTWFFKKRTIAYLHMVKLASLPLRGGEKEREGD